MRPRRVWWAGPRRVWCAGVVKGWWGGGVLVWFLLSGVRSLAWSVCARGRCKNLCIGWGGFDLVRYRLGGKDAGRRPGRRTPASYRPSDTLRTTRPDTRSRWICWSSTATPRRAWSRWRSKPPAVCLLSCCGRASGGSWRSARWRPPATGRDRRSVSCEKSEPGGALVLAAPWFWRRSGSGECPALRHVRAPVAARRR